MEKLSSSSFGRAWGRLLAVVGMALVAVGITTLPASAHHPLISGQADCQGNVSYTSTAWSSTNPAARANPSVLIQIKVNGSWQQVGSGAYASGNNYSFGGTFKQPSSGFPFQLRAYAAGTWGDKAGGGQTTETTVGAPSGCQTSPPVLTPKATVTHTCTTWTATLDNSASTGSVVYTVTGVGSPAPSKTVAAKGSGSLTGALHSGQSYTITVNAGPAGGTSKSVATSTFDTKSCGGTTGTPSASVTVACTGYTVTVANTGGGTTRLPFVVTVNGTSSTVQADSTPQEVSGKLTSGTNTFTVTQNGKTLVTKTFDASTCGSTSPPVQKPTAQISVDCNGFVTTLVNTASTVPVTYTVTTRAGTPSAVAHTETVNAGSSQSFTWPVENKVPQTVTVSAPGLATVTQSFSGDCAVVSPPTSGSPTPSPTSSSSPSSSPSVSAPATSGTGGTSSGTTSTGSSGTGSSSASSASTGSSSLPRTGSTISPLVLGFGMLLALAGGGLLLVDRHRRRRA